MQSAARVRELFPAAHAVQFTASTLEKVPASQAVHVRAAVEAWVYMPAEHVMQSSNAAVGAYLPAVHHSHALALKMYDPPGHATHWLRSAELKRMPSQAVQSEASSCSVTSAALASSLILPAGQSRHPPSSPEVVTMRPMGHTVQVEDPVESAYDPGLHRVQDEERAVEYVPVGHSMQAPRFSTRVVVSENLPEPHQRQMPKLIT